jgi:hypothetical protein
MKKILFIHHAAGWGGAPNSMIKLIKAMNRISTMKVNHAYKK